ncbi:MAG: RNA methyltransferase [Armatimonadota bacterium]|nr:RNA methyltransferase [Armatimonadota bacterium]MCX7777137.1 RNA methyltransferase [Armatimonadota bacterium]MDW8025184.1 RNA methyltransferase [Armatimonadota bacterium]
MLKRPSERECRPPLSEARNCVRLPICVILDSIRSLYNVGAIFRISDGAGIRKLYLCGITGCPPDPEIEKTALGATLSVFWEYHQDVAFIIASLREQGWKVVALERTYESLPYTAFPKEAFPVCLVVGNEVDGVSDAALKLCDFAIEIPQLGWKRSLNVAVAYGIAVYELVRKWMECKGSESAWSL